VNLIERVSFSSADGRLLAHFRRTPDLDLLNHP